MDIGKENGNWVVAITHPAKFLGPDPHITSKGFMAIVAVANFLPDNPPVVVCGTSTRLMETAEAAGLEPNNWSVTAGSVESGIKKTDGAEVIVLANGTELNAAPGVDMSIDDSIPAVLRLIKRLPARSIIVTGRPFMIALDLAGFKNSQQSASVYYINRDGDGNVIGIYAMAENGSACV